MARVLRVLRSSALITLLGLPVACGPAPQSDAPRAPRAVLVHEVATTGAAWISLPGTLEALDQVEISFEVPGRIVELHAQEGRTVTTGELLGRLDARDYQANLDAAVADLAKAQADLDRNKQLLDQGIVAESEFDRYRRVLENARAAQQKAEKALADTVVKAPYDGRIARRLAETEQTVPAKQPILLFQRAEGLKVQVGIPEALVAAGRRDVVLADRIRSIHAEVTVAGIADQRFPAVPIEFATSPDPTTRTFRATLRIEPPANLPLFPGMTVTVHARPPEAKEIVAVPSRAVVADSEKRATVWIVDRDTMAVRRQPIALGEVRGDLVEVRDGLTPGTWVCETGKAMLTDGDVVRRLELR